MRLHDLQPDQGSFLEDVLQGLQARTKALSPKYLYDHRGSELFDKICRVPEYYPTRTEISILTENAPEIARLLGPGCALLELGSGASSKTRILLDRLDRPFAYVPVDISREYLLESSEKIAHDYPDLRVIPVCADFTRPESIAQALQEEENEAIEVGRPRRAAFFPGSTIGNFDPADARAFMRRTSNLLAPGGMFVVGVDLVKDVGRLEAAYDDAEGVTAAFNLNLLARINTELAGRFDLDSFEHRAFFNRELSRIEMHLRSLRDQVVPVAGRMVRFRAGETIHTESSYKYRPETFEQMAEECGFEVVRYWTDPDGLYRVYCLRSLVELSADDPAKVFRMTAMRKSASWAEAPSAQAA